MRVRWFDQKAKAAALDGQQEALVRGTEFLLGASNETVPFEEGILASSGFTDVDGDTGVVAYDTPYAARLHENPDFTFQHGRRGKWLQLTFQEKARAVQELMARVVRSRFP